MRVALVVNGFPVASETFIYNQAAGLEARGVAVTVVAAHEHGQPELFADSQRTFRGPIRHAILGPTLSSTTSRALHELSRGPSRSIELIRAATARYGVTRRALRAYLLAVPISDFDIVHFEFSGLAVAWLDAVRLLERGRIVVSCRGTAERITPVVDATRAKQLEEVFAIATRVHCVSHDLVEKCRSYGLDPSKAFVNPPAIDTSTFRRSGPVAGHATGPFRLISTGRLHWAKGIEFGVLAVHRLIQRGYDVHYSVIGSGPEFERLRFAVHDLDLDRHVTLVGTVPAKTVREQLEASDVYVLPSVSEGVSNAALEAMAMEMPVVATNVGGMPEAIEAGVDGILVRSRDPETLADAIAELLTDPARRACLGKRARQRIERDFSIDRQVATFVAEYERISLGTPQEQS